MSNPRRVRRPRKRRRRPTIWPMRRRAGRKRPFLCRVRVSRLRCPPRSRADAAVQPVAVVAAAGGVPPVEGPALLDKVRPLMRRNRRGPGGSGSVPFLARGLRCKEADLMAGFAALGLVLPPVPTDKPIFVEIGEHVWWLNQDSRGGIWINGREKLDGDPQPDAEGQPAASNPAPGAESLVAPAAEATPAPSTEAAPAPVAEPIAPALAPAPEFVAPVSAIPPPPAPANVLTGVRLLLKETKNRWLCQETRPCGRRLVDVAGGIAHGAFECRVGCAGEGEGEAGVRRTRPEKSSGSTATPRKSFGSTPRPRSLLRADQDGAEGEKRAAGAGPGPRRRSKVSRHVLA